MEGLQDEAGFFEDFHTVSSLPEPFLSPKSSETDEHRGQRLTCYERTCCFFGRDKKGERKKQEAYRCPKSGVSIIWISTL